MIAKPLSSETALKRDAANQQQFCSAETSIPKEVLGFA
jgi:hypothetical protein